MIIIFGYRNGYYSWIRASPSGSIIEINCALDFVLCS